MSPRALRLALVTLAPFGCVIMTLSGTAAQATGSAPARSAASVAAAAPASDPAPAAAHAGATSTSQYPTAYVVNEDSHSLQPIDSQTNKAGPQIRITKFGLYWGLAIAPDGATAYVNNFGGGGTPMFPVNLTTSKVESPITVGANPGDIAITPDGAMAYVPISPDASPPYHGFLVPVDLATGTAETPIPVGLAPFGIAITPSGQTAYVVNSGSNSVTPVDLATGTAGPPIAVGDDPADIAITPNGAMAYVTNSDYPSVPKHSTVTPINLATNTPESPITVGQNPEGIAITPDGRTAYVVNNQDSTVTPIDLATGKTGKQIKVGNGAFGIAISPAGGVAYVADSNVNTVTPIDLATNKPEKPIKTGKAPVQVHFAPGWYVPSAAPAKTDMGAALAVFQGSLYSAFTAASGTVSYARRLGARWSAAKTIRGSWGKAASKLSPALAVFGGKLYAFWTAASKGKIQYSAFNGSSWSAPATLRGSWGQADSATRPAATTSASGSELDVAWTTTSGSVDYSRFAGTSWAKQATAAATVTADAPAIVGVANNANTPHGASTVMFAWTTKTGDVAYGELTFQGFKDLGDIPGPLTNAPPSLGFAGNSANGTLYVAWKSRSNGTIGYKAVYLEADTDLEPALWTPTEYQPEARSSAGPALAASGYVLYLGWLSQSTGRVDISYALNPY